jgi:hypothetical protein
MAYYAAMAVVPEKWLAFARGLDPARRELAIAAGCLLLGATLMPLAVWVAGSASLGPYVNGGLGALFADYFRGLASGSLAAWIVLAGPYLLVALLRLTRTTLARIDARS